MESELKILSPKPIELQPEPVISVGDDRPLLKPEPNIAQPHILSTEELEKKYAAFVRHDVYGTMGMGELPWTEKILLALGLVLLVPLRVVAGIAILVIYYVICRVCTAFLTPNREDGQEDYAHMGGWRRAVIMQSGRFLARSMLFVFGFYRIRERTTGNQVDGQLNHETVTREQKDEFERPGAIVSNHVSYIDILFHMSSSFPSFVAKRSVANLPLVGLIRCFSFYYFFYYSKCLGCVYVQREMKSSDFKGVSGVVNGRIWEAHQNESAPKFMLFPEGTTTNGGYILPFKSGAFLAKAPLLPVILRYPYQRLSPAWDSISGVRHLIYLLCQFVNYIEVMQLPVYHPSEQEKEDPKLYAENVRKLMAREGNLILSDIGLGEKRNYHAALNGIVLYIIFCMLGIESIQVVGYLRDLFGVPADKYGGRDHCN